MKKLHLVCNAHLDPYWLWEWEEGAAEAISTFRTAADLLEEYPEFVFCHNEVILYRWVEEFEPALFERIQRLVAEGRWHIMGGWYVQPDCNMPSGESFVRQALVGRRYFDEKFGKRPTTAINFDPFGHTRGLVQILAKSGYDSYIHCRPNQNDCPLPADIYTWVGYDGSTVTGCRQSFYGTLLGQARKWTEHRIDNWELGDLGLMLWGVGDHGGGASRGDLNDLRQLVKDRPEVEIAQSTPEAFFAELRASGYEPPRHEGDLNSWAVGCYTSQIRIKQKHRQLEDELYVTEKLMSHAALAGLTEYPASELQSALRDLLLSEFHDILPGSSIQPVEEAAIRLQDHALEICSRLKARAFFFLCAGQPKAAEGEIPIMAYNPHPYPVHGVFECEFNLANQGWEGTFTDVHVYQGATPVPTQVEKELSSVPIDWRKRVAFEATLAPGQVNRFDCKLEVLPEKPKLTLVPEGGKFVFRGQDLTAIISCETGFLESLIVNGIEYLGGPAFRPLVLADNEDSWGMTVMAYRDVVGEFSLMDEIGGQRVCALPEPLPTVRVVEDGPVRTIVETVLSWGDSFIIQRYLLPKQGIEVEVQTRVYWNEKEKLLKLAVPTAFEAPQFFGQVAYGVEEFGFEGKELIAQQWVTLTDAEGQQAISCINDGVYGFSYEGSELRITLLRSPAYSGHPIHQKEGKFDSAIPGDRYSPHQDQGERQFRLWLKPGPAAERLEVVDREALAHSEKPYVISFFPSGAGKVPAPLAKLSDAAVQITALKQAEDGKGYIVRLFNPTGQPRATELDVPVAGLNQTLTLGAFELKSFRLDDGKLTECNLMEE